MKTIVIFFCSFLMSIGAWAQNVDPQNRDISLRILNKKGRPVSNIVVQSRRTNMVGMTDRAGVYVFNNMDDDDTIIANLPKFGKTMIPVKGMEHIVIMVRSSMHYSYVNNSGQTVVIQRDVTGSSTVLDVQAMLKRRNYNSLAELLRGQVSGMIVSISGGTASAQIRGISSINSNNEALVVVDGREVGTLNDANTWVNVHDIKTIEVVKDGAGWGVRGANGVIIVNTK